MAASYYEGLDKYGLTRLPVKFSQIQPQSFRQTQITKRNGRRNEKFSDVVKDAKKATVFDIASQDHKLSPQ
jgi:hypothetical protein